MKEKFYFKLWQKNEIEEAASFDFIKSLGDEKVQIFDLKTGWHWLNDFENKIIKKNIKI